MIEPQQEATSSKVALGAAAVGLLIAAAMQVLLQRALAEPGPDAYEEFCRQVPNVGVPLWLGVSAVLLGFGIFSVAQTRQLARPWSGAIKWANGLGWTEIVLALVLFLFNGGQVFVVSAGCNGL